MVRKKDLKEELKHAHKFRIRVNKKIAEQKKQIDIMNYEIKKLKSNEINHKIDIKELKNKLNKKEKYIDELEYELNKADKTISNLEKMLSKKHPDWHIEGGFAWRINPKTKKHEKVKVPKNFNINYVDVKDYDEEKQTVTFIYKEDEGSSYGKEYTIKISLYTQMGGKLFLTPKKMEDEINYYLTLDELKNKIIEKGGNIQGKNIDLILQFCIDNQEKIFTAKEFCKNCNIKKRQTGDYYIKKLIKWGLIEKVKRGTYKGKKL